MSHHHFTAGRLQREMSVVPQVSVTDSFCNLFKVSITGNCIDVLLHSQVYKTITLYCEKSKHLKYKCNPNQNQHAIDLHFNFESQSFSFQMNGSCVIHEQRFFTSLFLSFFPLTCSHVSFHLAFSFCLSSFLRLRSCPWACDTKNNGKEQKSL